MTEPETDIGKEIKRSLRRLVTATVVIYLALAVVGGLLFYQGARQRDDLAKVAFSTNAALCTLRGDLARRVADSVQFLTTHPHGIDGITPALIRESIDNQQRTIDALGSLECSP